MLILRDRYFYVDLSNPRYPQQTVDGVACYEVGSLTVEGYSRAADSSSPISAASFSVVSAGGAPLHYLQAAEPTISATKMLRYRIFVPTSYSEGQDGHALIAFTYTPYGSVTPVVLHASVRAFPLMGFVVSGASIPAGTDVWAIDLTADCNAEALNADAISVSITDIIFTATGERPRRTSYGSPLPRAMWHNIDSAMAETLLDKTTEAIARWENRIRIDRQRSSMMIDKPNHAVTLTIPYVVLDSQKKVLYRKKFEY